MKALLIGATGLIGRLVLEKLVASEQYSEVHVIARNPLHLSDLKIIHYSADFDTVLDHPDEYKSAFAVDQLFCTLGTTIKTVGGNKDLFTKVDKTWPLAIASLAIKQGCQAVFAVSSLGSNSQSASLYPRVKGELEVGLELLSPKTLVIYQPSLLIGKRDGLDQPNRAGEKVGQALMPIFSHLLRGSMRKYRGTPVTDIADQMLCDGLAPTAGTRRHHFTGS